MSLRSSTDPLRATKRENKTGISAPQKGENGLPLVTAFITFWSRVALPTMASGSRAKYIISAAERRGQRPERRPSSLSSKTSKSIYGAAMAARPAGCRAASATAAARSSFSGQIGGLAARRGRAAVWRRGQAGRRGHPATRPAAAVQTRWRRAKIAPRQTSAALDLHQPRNNRAKIGRAQRPHIR